MASSILLKRSSSALTKFFQPLRSVSATPSVSRSFNTNALRETFERDLDRRCSESQAAESESKYFREASDAERDNDKRRSESESESESALVSATPSSDDERDIDQRRSESSLGFLLRDLWRDIQSIVFDPISECSSQVLHTVDQLMDLPSCRFGGGLRRGMNAEEDNDALHLRAKMPGFGKEDVKVNFCGGEYIDD